MMKKKKRVFLNSLCVGMLVLTVALLSGCGSKSYTLDEEELANAFLQDIKFDTTLYQVQPERVGDFLTMENAEKQIFYMGNGAYADSFGIFALSDENAAQAAVETVKSYLTDLQDSFQDYLPEEAAEIEGSVTVQKGRYVVFCVSPDSAKAQELIDNHIKEGETDSGDTEQAQEDADVNTDETSQNDEAKQMSIKAVGDYPSVKASGKLKSFGNVVEIGDAGFELYSYTESGAKKYADAVNRAAEKLDGVSDVYEVLIPLGSGVTLPDEYFGKIQSSNQRKALDKIIAKADKRVKVVDLYDNLMKHRDEYIYYRTDHHWTSLGAYYGYERFCEAKGIMPITTERRETADFGDFLGSFYNDTNKSKKMEKHPDKLKVYKPISADLSLKYTSQKGSTAKWDVIHDVSDYPIAIKYSAFIAGDNPYTVIKNNSLADGSSCVVVKESFGNALVPYLTDHYETIYVIDYRYWEGDLASLAKEKKVDDVIFANNLSMIRSDYLTGKLSQLVEK